MSIMLTNANQRGTDGGMTPMGGWKSQFFKFCFGQKVAPKEAFGTKMSGVTTEFDEEAESAIESVPKALKRDLFDVFVQCCFLCFPFFIPPSVHPPIGSF